MPVHIRSITHGDLRLTLTSGGEIVDSQLAQAPRRRTGLRS
jgi:hypothetical protein